jgi:hypothetical protein
MRESLRRDIVNDLGTFAHQVIVRDPPSLLVQNYGVTGHDIFPDQISNLRRHAQEITLCLRAFRAYTKCRGPSQRLRYGLLVALGASSHTAKA